MNVRARENAEPSAADTSTFGLLRDQLIKQRACRPLPREKSASAVFSSSTPGPRFPTLTCSLLRLVALRWSATHLDCVTFGCRFSAKKRFSQIKCQPNGNFSCPTNVKVLILLIVSDRAEHKPIMKNLTPSGPALRYVVILGLLLYVLGAPALP